MVVAENDRVIMNRWVHIAHGHRNQICRVEIRLKPIISASLVSSRSLAFCRISRRRNRRLSESLITRITNIPPKQIEIQSRVSANLSGARVNAPLISSGGKRDPAGRTYGNFGEGGWNSRSIGRRNGFSSIFRIDNYKSSGFARRSRPVSWSSIAKGTAWREN